MHLLPDQHKYLLPICLDTKREHAYNICLLKYIFMREQVSLLDTLPTFKIPFNGMGYYI